MNYTCQHLYTIQLIVISHPFATGPVKSPGGNKAWFRLHQPEASVPRVEGTEGGLRTRELCLSDELQVRYATFHDRRIPLLRNSMTLVSSMRNGDNYAKGLTHTDTPMFDPSEDLQEWIRNVAIGSTR